MLPFYRPRYPVPSQSLSPDNDHEGHRRRLAFVVYQPSSQEKDRWLRWRAAQILKGSPEAIKILDAQPQSTKDLDQAQIFNEVAAQFKDIQDFSDFLPNLRLSSGEDAHVNEFIAQMQQHNSNMESYAFHACERMCQEVAKKMEEMSKKQKRRDSLLTDQEDDADA